MRLLVGFTLVIFSVAFAQSQLVIPQINNLNTVLALLPQLQTFLGQLNNAFPQLSAVLSSEKLQLLQQQVVQLVLSQVSNFNANTLVNQLQQIVEQAVGSSGLLPSNWKDTLRGLVQTVLPFLSNLGKREITDGRISLNDILALADKLPLGTLDALFGSLPQVSTLVNQLNGLLASVAGNLQLSQLQLLDTQILQSILSQANNLNQVDLVNKLVELIQKVVGVNGPALDNLKAILQKLVGAVFSFLPNLGKREVTDGRISLNDILALADKLPLGTLDALFGSLPQVSTLVNQLNGLLASVAGNLQLSQLQLLDTQILQSILSQANNLNQVDLVNKLVELVQKVVGVSGPALDKLKAILQKLVGAVFSFLPTLGKRNLNVNNQ